MTSKCRSQNCKYYNYYAQNPLLQPQVCVCMYHYHRTIQHYRQVQGEQPIEKKKEFATLFYTDKTERYIQIRKLHFMLSSDREMVEQISTNKLSTDLFSIFQIWTIYYGPIF